MTCFASSYPQAGQLKQAVQELKSLLHLLSRREGWNRASASNSNSCQDCGRNLEEKQDLERKLHKTVDHVERNKAKLKQTELENKIKYEEIQIVRNKVYDCNYEILYSYTLLPACTA